jgi:hypothetical protein
MHHKTKRLILYTLKNFLVLLGYVLIVVSFGAYIFFLKEYFELTDEAAFVFTIFPSMLIVGIWLCFVKARSDVATLEREEERLVELLKKEYN